MTYPTNTFKETTVSDLLQLRREFLLELKREGVEICEWRLDDEELNTWRSSCGELWSFVEGGPLKNRVVFCQYCGKGALIDAASSEESEEDDE